MQEKQIKNLLKAMNFVPEDGKSNIYNKTYSMNPNYAIKVDFNSEQIDYGDIVEDGWKSLSNTSEIFKQWNKAFKSSGIFDEQVVPYDVQPPKHLTYRDLKDLTEDDSGYIYNQLDEILRRNAVSDKQNAFNKLLNLLICKIKDEDKAEDSVLQFQVLDGQTDEELQIELNKLYKDGMYEFLGEETISLQTRKDIEDAFTNSKRSLVDNADLINMLWDRFKDNTLKSPGFSFKELDSDKSIKENAKIVRELVLLLQKYKFRYSKKEQFLGTFFEQLLTKSVKQEVGQYFTPVDIAKFAVYSLPLKEYIEGMIEEQGSTIIPVAIDFACGSGHFLIEYMEAIQCLIEKIDTNGLSKTAGNNIKSWKSDRKFAWAKDYVYGIDIDDRLVKTSKVAAFLNGDGDANIIWGNGLDNFHTSEDYDGKLKNKANNKNNGNFDILISNPPYSVDGFKSTLNDGESSFDLYSELTEKSKEIECLFVERMKQLLKIGGMAAVILPVSFLTSSKLHSKARSILLKYFYIRAMVELNANTFAKTPTKTVILFLERRSDGDCVAIENAINNFFDSKNDVTVMGIENAFSKFVSCVYEGLDFHDYLKFIDGKKIDHDVWKDYQNAHTCVEKRAAKIFDTEKEKMLYFLLTYPQKIVLVKAGDKNNGKRFLGFWFSDARGKEGEVRLSTGTELYNSDDLMDATKANSYIYNAYKGIFDMKVADNLTDHISYSHLSNLIEYGTNKFDKKINLSEKQEIVLSINSKYETKKLSEVVDPIRGVTYDGKKDRVYEETDTIVLTADHITAECRFEIKKDKKVYIDSSKKFDLNKQLKKDDIFICFSSGSKRLVGKCAYIPKDTTFYAGGFMGILRKKSNDIDMKYLFAVLSSRQYRNAISESSTGAGINNLSNAIGDIKIPVPDSDIQKEVIKKIEEIDQEYNSTRMTEEDYREKIEKIFEDMEIM